MRYDARMRRGRGRWRVGFLVLGIGLACAARGWADDTYKGVALDSSHVPDHLAAPPGSPVVTWPGFTMNPDGSSVVFVQTGREPKIVHLHGRGRLVWLLEGLRLPRGNLRRPLVTHYFDTPVDRVRLEKRKRGVALILHMRRSVKPKLAVTRHDSGYFFVTLTFAAGAG